MAMTAKAENRDMPEHLARAELPADGANGVLVLTRFAKAGKGIETMATQVHD